jgi:hypothetical protein
MRLKPSTANIFERGKNAIPVYGVTSLPINSGIVQE